MVIYLSIFGLTGPYRAFIAVYRLSLVAVSRGYSLVVVHGLLIAVASLIERHGYREYGLSSCGI